MKICIAGKNNIAVDCVRYLISELGVGKEDIVVCFNKTDDGIDSFQLSFRKFCQQEEILAIDFSDIYTLTDFVFFSLEFDRIIRTEEMNTTRIFNIHFSLLPKYRGMYTSVWPILFGDDKSGVTLHCIDDGIDTGDIVEQLTFPLSSNETCRSLYLKYIETGTILFKKMIKAVLSDDYQQQPQMLEGASYFSTDALDFSKIVIDFNRSARDVRNQIRAFSFREYQLPIIHGMPIEYADILTTRSSEKVGSVVSENGNYIDVATLDYDVRCYEKIV